MAENLLPAVSRIALLAPLAALACGCAALNTFPSADIAASAIDDPDAQPQATATVSLEIRAAGKEPEFQQIPLQGVMHVQDVLEQTNLARRFRRMDLRVMRQTGDQLAKLEATYKPQTGRVDPLYDYSLHPGDHLVVIEDTSTILDDVLEKLSSPLSPPRRR